MSKANNRKLRKNSKNGYSCTKHMVVNLTLHPEKITNTPLLQSVKKFNCL